MSHRALLVSFVVPSFNYGRYIGECVRSLLAQTIDDFEVIVVDDGSTDETPDVMTQVTDPRVRYVRRTANKGLIETLSEGIRAARGRYVARLDADDRYRPYFLEETLPILEAHPDAGLVYGDIAHMDASGAIVADPWGGMTPGAAHQGRDGFGDEFAALLDDYVVASPVIGPREVWLAALPFPAWFTYPSVHDWYLTLKIAKRHPLYYRARTLADYRVHPRNMHRQPVDGKTVEDTLIHILQELMSEKRPDAERQALARRVYARTYLQLADRYFGLDRHADAWRCAIRGWCYCPATVLDARRARRIAGAYVK